MAIEGSSKQEKGAEKIIAGLMNHEKMGIPEKGGSQIKTEGYKSYNGVREKVRMAVIRVDRD